MEFKDIVQKRYAAKKFDGKTIPQEKINQLFEIIRYAASSYGIQPWKIKVISDPKVKESLLEASYNQPQITTCSHLLVFCADSDVMALIDKLEATMVEVSGMGEGIKAYGEMMRGSFENRSEVDRIAWAQRQCYIALGNAINGAKSLGFDSCPMEGFQPDAYKKILGLADNLHATALVTLGYAADEPRPKIRFPAKDVFI